jgi:hypothetical protein
MSLSTMGVFQALACATWQKDMKQYRKHKKSNLSYLSLDPRKMLVSQPEV